MESVDYEKLIKYLRKKYNVKQVFYYSGIETHGYEPILRYDEEYPIEYLFKYLNKLAGNAKRKEKEVLEKDIKRIRFLRKIKSFGYVLRLKPVKHIRSYDGGIKMKANCDVDLTFDVMRLEKNFDNLILLSGDGDFEILVRYFKEEDRNFLIFANAWSMARVFRYQYSKNVREFSEIKNTIEK